MTCSLDIPKTDPRLESQEPTHPLSEVITASYFNLFYAISQLIDTLHVYSNSIATFLILNNVHIVIFITFFTVSVDTKTSEVFITRAGHVFPMSGYMEFRVAEIICEELGFL